jgi:hypothetical protein
VAIRYYFTASGRGETRLAAVSDKTRTGETQYKMFDSQRPVATDERHPMGVLQMSHSQEKPSFETRGGYGPSVAHHLANGEDDPTELFVHTPAQITGAYVDPSMRHVLPTMVGLAMHRMAGANAPIMADYRLTNYSSALSQRAAAKGLAVSDPRNPDMSPDEDENFPIDYEEMPTQSMSVGTAAQMRSSFDEVSPHDVRNARNTVRRRLGRQKRPARKVGSQFEQLRMDL